MGRAFQERMCKAAVENVGAGYYTLADAFSGWRDSALEVAFVIGSSDGLAESVKHDANIVIALSALTLPHGLARVMLAEQLYRAASLLQGHPYHRE